MFLNCATAAHIGNSMPESRYKLKIRFDSFLHRLKAYNFKSWTLAFHFTGYLIGVFLLLSSLNVVTVFLVCLIIAGYFWNKLLREFFEKIEPLAEILLLLVIIFNLLVSYYQSLFDFLILPSLNQVSIQIISLSPLLFLLALLLLSLSILLVMNSSGKRMIVLYYIFLTFIGIYFLKFSDRTLWYLFQFILLFLLYRKTWWLEELTKVECWIYFGVILTIFLNFSALPYISQTPDNTTYIYAWYYLPKFISHLLQLYLLALLIKIPFVLVYHHASLSRKVRIAGWLQSSLPQLFQLVILLMVFYFVISGWQAEKMRDAIIKQIQNMTTLAEINQLSIYKIDLTREHTSIEIPGYLNLSNKGTFPDQGVIKLTSKKNDKYDYFLFSRIRENTSDVAYFMKLDTLILKEISNNLPMLMASHILSYPFQISRWDSILYKVQFWQKLKKYRAFQIYPFGLIPHESSYLISVKFEGDLIAGDKSESKQRIVIFGHRVFTAGRVFIPLYNRNFIRSGFWAFDISIFPSLAFLTSTFMQQLLFWFIIYLLINGLIIKRVVRFGNQIYSMIIQKFNSLKLGIREISDGNLDYKIRLEGQDEFFELGNRFNQMGEELKRKISDLREKDRLEFELNSAREVQLSLLPNQLPDIPGYRITAGIRTATEVGGDFYDLFPIDQKKYLFVIGDVSGKGTSAAFYMAQCLSLIRFSRQFSDQPREILLQLNRYFSDPMVDRQIFVTGIIGILDTKRHSIQMLRAGHNHPILIPTDNSKPLINLETSGLGLGLERQGDIFEKNLEKKHLRLKQGDTILFYTDGLVEAARRDLKHTPEDSQVEFFGEDQLTLLLQKVRALPAQEMSDLIFEEIEKFYGNTPLIDDFTLLIIQRVKNQPGKIKHDNSQKNR